MAYNASASTLESLAVGQTLNDTFTYSVTDGTNFTDATVTVTIAGENDVPVSTADVARARENGDVVLIDLFYNDRDVDTGDTLTLHMPEMTTAHGATLTTLAADRVTVGGTLEAGDAYAITVTIDGAATTVSYTTLATDTEITDIELSLIELINTDETLSSVLTASSGPANGVILISAKSSDTSFSTTVNSTNVTGGDFNDASASVVRTTVVGYDPDSVSDFNTMTTGDKVVDTFSYKALDPASAAKVAVKIEGEFIADDTVSVTLTHGDSNAVTVTYTVTGDEADNSAIEAELLAALTSDGTLGSLIDVVADGTNGGLTISSKNSAAVIADATTTQASADSNRPLTAEVTVPGIEATRVNVTVSGANDRPDAVSETTAVQVVEDGDTVSVDVLANDTDADLVDTVDTLIINSATSANGARR